ncbi:MAG TPA: hypothetical protein VHA56_10260 [Mucilaginibacter sp.]|nr:hypothetical protein [Mucilaginibacter sp.]
MEIIGNKFSVQFGTAKAILHFQSETSMTFTITEKSGAAVDITEKVSIQLTELRPGLYMVSWQEASGTTVTQVQDHDNGMVYSNWTSPGGEFNSRKGTVKQLPAS